MSVLLVCAVVKAEDRHFFQHGGFDWAQAKRGIRRSIAGEGLMGGSTITQQLARNLFLGPERTPHRKLREAFLTRALESHLSKPRILELYLNVIEWGENEWGARAASRRYFGKEPDELDAFEASFLAALIAAPRAPVRGRNAERLRRVQSRVLVQLYASGLLGQDETWSALARAEASYRRLSRGVAIDVALRESAGRAAAVEGSVRRRYRFLVLGNATRLAPERSLAGGCGIEREQG
jgi:membrane peptidoglycan carboxypeptidase